MQKVGSLVLELNLNSDKYNKSTIQLKAEANKLAKELNDILTITPTVNVSGKAKISDNDVGRSSTTNGVAAKIRKLGTSFTDQSLTAGSDKKLLSQLKNSKQAALDAIKDISKAYDKLPKNIKTAVDRATDQIELADKRVKKSLKKTGEDVGAGLNQGLKSQIDDIRKTSAQMADATTQPIKSKLQIKSPSRVFQQIGDNVVKGLKQGLDAGEVRSAMSRIEVEFEKARKNLYQEAQKGLLPKNLLKAELAQINAIKNQNFGEITSRSSDPKFNNRQFKYRANQQRFQFQADDYNTRHQNSLAPKTSPINSLGSSLQSMATGAIGGLKGIILSTLTGIVTGVATTLTSTFVSIIQSGLATVSSFVGNSINKFAELQGVSKALEKIVGAKNVGDSLKYIREQSDKLGVSLPTARNGFMQIAAAAQGTALEKYTKQIFEAANATTNFFNLSNADYEGIIVAFRQLATGATITTEDLNQIAERVPGAFKIAAESIGVTTIELKKLLSLGAVRTEDFLPRFAASLQEEFGTIVETTSTSRTRVENAMSAIQESLGKAIEPAVSAGFEFVADSLNEIGNSTGLFDELNVAAQDFANYLKENPQLVRATAEGIADLTKSGMRVLGESAQRFLNYLEKNPDAIQQAVTAARDFATTLKDLIALAYRLLKPLSEAIQMLYKVQKTMFEVSTAVPKGIGGFIGDRVNDLRGFFGQQNSRGVVRPAQGRISSPYGMRTHPVFGGRRMHHGIDIANRQGTPIVAPTAGKITGVKYQKGGAGRYLEMTSVDKQGRKIEQQFLHLSKALVKVGDFVKQGQVIGRMGSTGASTGSHLDWRLKINGKRIDPQKFLNMNIQIDGLKESASNGQSLRFSTKGKDWRIVKLSQQRGITRGGNQLSQSEKSRLTGLGRELYKYQQNPNVMAFADVVARAEGTDFRKGSRNFGYGMLIGGSQTNDFSKHPFAGNHGKRIKRPIANSTASGRYQMMDFNYSRNAAKRQFGSSNSDLSRIFKGENPESFSPAVQDLYFTASLKQRGILDEVLAGNFEAALRNPQLGKHYASIQTGNRKSNYKGQGTPEGQLRNTIPFARQRQRARMQTPQNNISFGTIPDSLKDAVTKIRTNNSEEEKAKKEAEKLLKEREKKQRELRQAIEQSYKTVSVKEREKREQDKSQRDINYRKKMSKLSLVETKAEPEIKSALAQRKRELEINRRFEEEIIKGEQDLQDLKNARSKKIKLQKSGVKLNPEETIDYSAAIKIQQSQLRDIKKLRDKELKISDVGFNAGISRQILSLDNDNDLNNIVNQYNIQIDKIKKELVNTNSEPIKLKLNTELELLTSERNFISQKFKLEKQLANLIKQRNQLTKNGFKNEDTSVQKVNAQIRNLNSQIQILTNTRKRDIALKNNQLSNQLSEIEKERNFNFSQQLGGLQSSVLAESLRQTELSGGDGVSIRQEMLMSESALEYAKNEQELNELAKTGQYTKEQINQLRQAFNDLNTIKLSNAQKELEKLQSDNLFAVREQLFNSNQGLQNSKIALSQTLGFNAKDLEKQSALAQIDMDHSSGLRQIEEFAKTSVEAANSAGLLKSNLEQLRDIQIANVSAQFDPWKQAFAELQGASESFIYDIITKPQDALKNLGQTMADFFAQMAAQMINQQIFGSLFGGATTPTQPTSPVGGLLSGLLGGLFYNGGVIPNYASGGMVGNISKAYQKEKSATGRQPYLIMASAGERVLNIEETKRFHQLGLDKVVNMNRGGIVGNISVPSGGNNVNANMNLTVNQNGGNGTDTAMFQRVVEAKMREVLHNEMRPGGTLNRDVNRNVRR